MYVMYYRGVQENSTLSAHKYQVMLLLKFNLFLINHSQVMFSLPTCKYPVAQATASVYFVVELSKLKPANCPVNVIIMVNRYLEIIGIFFAGVILV